MGEATRDSQSPASESKKGKEKIRGWIRMHTDDDTQLPSVEQSQDSEVQSPNRKPRKELERPVE
jgi:hypothetical protein